MPGVEVYEEDLQVSFLINSSIYLKNKLMNWVNFLHGGNDVIIFAQTTNHAWYL